MGVLGSGRKGMTVVGAGAGASVAGVGVSRTGVEG